MIIVCRDKSSSHFFMEIFHCFFFPHLLRSAFLALHFASNFFFASSLSVVVWLVASPVPRTWHTVNQKGRKVEMMRKHEARTKIKILFIFDVVGMLLLCSKHSNVHGVCLRVCERERECRAHCYEVARAQVDTKVKRSRKKLKNTLWIIYFVIISKRMKEIPFVRSRQSVDACHLVCPPPLCRCERAHEIGEWMRQVVGGGWVMFLKLEISIKCNKLQTTNERQLTRLADTVNNAYTYFISIRRTSIIEAEEI